MGARSQFQPPAPHATPKTDKMFRATTAFVLIFAFVMLYDLAIAVATTSEAASGHRKLMAFAVPQVPINPVTGFLNGAAGMANGYISTVNGLAAGALAPVLGVCF